MCLPAEGTTLGGPQAPTHSIPLRLAPAVTPTTAKTEPRQTTHTRRPNNNPQDA
jgi:hypothetical protein